MSLQKRDAALSAVQRGDVDTAAVPGQVPVSRQGNLLLYEDVRKRWRR